MRYETTDKLAGTGGNDAIVLGNGNNVVFGGMGADTITTGTGTDTIFGDNGYVQMDVEGGKFAKWGSKSQDSTTGSLSVKDLGGNDVIVTIDGDKNLVGGDGEDKITAGNGNHVVAGDNVEVSYVAIGLSGAGLALRYETTDMLAGTGGVMALTGEPDGLPQKVGVPIRYTSHADSAASRSKSARAGAAERTVRGGEAADTRQSLADSVWMVHLSIG